MDKFAPMQRFLDNIAIIISTSHKLAYLLGSYLESSSTSSIRHFHIGYMNYRNCMNLQLCCTWIMKRTYSNEALHPSLDDSSWVDYWIRNIELPATIGYGTQNYQAREINLGSGLELSLHLLDSTQSKYRICNRTRVTVAIYNRNSISMFPAKHQIRELDVGALKCMHINLLLIKSHCRLYFRP